MNIKAIKVIKSDERGIIYDCGEASFLSRKKGSISADHVHSEHETLCLVKGEIELTVGDETQIVKAPITFEVPSNVYHKLRALTDIELVYCRKDL